MMNRIPNAARASLAYTVVAMSGARGTEFSDPEEAALAFSRANASFRPFVLRHQGSSSVVVASTNKGRKCIRATPAIGDRFVFALRELLDAGHDGK